METEERPSNPIVLHGPRPGDKADTRTVLTSLPAWFGDDAARQRYIDTAPDFPTLTARSGPSRRSPVGLLSLSHPRAGVSEIHLMAVAAPYRGLGIGTRLLHAALRHLVDRSVHTLQVKTLSDRSADPHYAETRRFYVARGFAPVAELPDEWSAHHPCLLMARPIEIPPPRPA